MTTSDRNLQRVATFIALTDWIKPVLRYTLVASPATASFLSNWSRTVRKLLIKQKMSTDQPFIISLSKQKCLSKGLPLVFLSLFFAFIQAEAQRYRLSSSEISFYSSAPLEDIAAHNTQAQSIFDISTGEIAFVVPIKGFQFRKSLMQEHFNENFMESDQYPHASFEGKLVGFEANNSSTQQVTAEGKLTIHGMTHDVKIPGEVKVGNGQIQMNAKFPVKVADYEIEIPKVVFYNIAEVVDVTVKFNYEPYQQ